MLRTQLPLVWMACICTLASSAENIRHVLELRPVELQVLARGEVAVAAVVACARSSASLRSCCGAQQAVRNRDAQHRRMALDVQAVAQAQRAELVLGQLAGEEAPRLVAELRDALLDERLVDGVVPVHARGTIGAAASRP